MNNQTTETKETESKILRCWRCGHTASVKGYEGAWFIRCDNHLCNAESHTFARRAYVIRWWNRRSPLGQEFLYQTSRTCLVPKVPDCPSRLKATSADEMRRDFEADIDLPNKPPTKPNQPAPVIAEFEALVRRRFAEWQKKHPDIQVASVTIPPITMMLVAMAADLSELYPESNTPIVTPSPVNPHTQQCAFWRDCHDGFDHPRECDCGANQKTDKD